MAYKKEWWERFLKPLKALTGEETADFAESSYCRAPMTDKPSNSDILNYYGRFREYAEHEDTLINSRLTWSLSIHAFLLTTYGLLVNKELELLLELNKPPLPHPPGQRYIVCILFAAQLVIALTGLVVGLTSFLAIRAAHRAILHLTAIAHSSKCFPLADSDTMYLRGEPYVPRGWLLPKLSGGGAPDNVDDAQLYYSGLPKLLSLCWFSLSVVSFLILIWSAYPPWHFFDHFVSTATRSSACQTSSPNGSCPGPRLQTSEACQTVDNFKEHAPQRSCAEPLNRPATCSVCRKHEVRTAPSGTIDHQPAPASNASAAP